MYQIDRDLLGYYVKKANTTYAALAEEMDIDRSTLRCMCSSELSA